MGGVSFRPALTGFAFTVTRKRKHTPPFSTSRSTGFGYISIGRELLDYTGLVFEYWHAYRDGAISQATFHAWMLPVRAGVEAALERAARADIKRLSGSCSNLLEHRAALWTFVDQHGVEPTNNHAERELRAFVLWRKRSFGSQSERGHRFAERLMTISHTARKQGRDVLPFLTACCEAALAGAAAPSLFADRA